MRRIAVLAIVAAVAVVYREALSAYLLEDDFHWLADARRFEWGNLVRLDRYAHFYRPVIELYFHAGHRLFGCAAPPFHAASLAIHLANVLIVFLFARRLSAHGRFAALAVLLFALQPGYVEAVAWVAAITDLLGAFWYLLTLLLFLCFLQTGARVAYAAALGAFVAGLLTHESTATLLPMLLLLDGLLALEGRAPAVPVRARLVRYAPFALLLAAFLVVAYVVNSRSYLVEEGYYAFGPHAVPNAFHYVVALYVGKRTLFDYGLIAAATAAVLIRGTPRMRFFVVWMFLAMLPVLFFTWGIASRYLYVPAAGFAMLLADLILAGEARAARWIRPRTAQRVLAAAAVLLAIRFAAFAQDRAAGFRASTAPYARLVAAIRADHAVPPPDGVVRVDRPLVEGIAEIYWNAVAETALCTADVRLMPR